LGYEIEGKGDTILGKIDLLVVDGDGYAHVIDYKTSPKDSFDSAKQRAFWYQMGLYHRMIENAGIRVNSPSPKVIVAPIKMHNFR
jgi:RecB family exonuclease